MTEMVKLMTSDGELVEVPKDDAMHSTLIRGIIEDSGAEEDIPLPQVKKAILEKIIVYWKYISQNAAPEIDKPLRSNQLSDVVNEWYADYVNVEQELLFELILAANFMNIKNLLELCCQSVANMIKGKSPEQIRSTFGITNDFPEQEEAEVTREHQWAFE